VGLAVVRSLGGPRRLVSGQDGDDFEQELVDQFALAVSASGAADRYVATGRSVIFGFIRFLGRPVWTASSGDADRFLVYLRKDLGQARATVEGKAATLARFFDFLLARY
jgi:hypothetical protein